MDAHKRIYFGADKSDNYFIAGEFLVCFSNSYSNGSSKGRAGNNAASKSHKLSTSAISFKHRCRLYLYTPLIVFQKTLRSVLIKGGILSDTTNSCLATYLKCFNYPKL